MEIDLIGMIYESTFFPETWTSVLDRLAAMTGSLGGHLYASTASEVRWMSSETIHETMTIAVDDGWMQREPRMTILRRAGRNGFITEFSTLDELSRYPFYADFLWKRGLGWGAGTLVEVPTGDTITLGVERGYEQGPLEAAAIRALDELRPHLARAALIASRLRLERARAMGEALAIMQIPAAVLDGMTTVLAVNSLAESMTEHVQWRARDRISLRDPKADAAFRDAVKGFDDDTARLVRSFPVHGSDGDAVFVAHLIPVTGDARDVFARSTCVMTLTPVASSKGPPIDLVQSLFDLTPAEARIARDLVAGETVDEIAARGKVSSSTVRTQMRAVLEKTGCRRQAEVVALLGGITMPLRNG